MQSTAARVQASVEENARDGCATDEGAVDGTSPLPDPGTLATGGTGYRPVGRHATRVLNAILQCASEGGPEVRRAAQGES